MNETEFESPSLEKDNTWAWGITIAIVLFIGLIILTVKIAMVDYPVEMDNQYRESYQYIDANYNELLKMSREFDSQGYQLLFPNQIQLGENQWKFTLKDKSGNSISDAELILLISREATTVDSIDVGKLEFKNGHYVSGNISINSPGFWELILQIKLGDLKLTRKTLLEIPISNQNSEDSSAINARSRKASITSQN